jgi:hypothetical protein
MQPIVLIRGLRAARLDRVLDALAGKAPAPRDPRLRRPRRAPGRPPQLGLRFLPTV